MLHASCLCGAVSWDVEGDLQFTSHCHCARCRKAHGTAFSTAVAVSERNFHLHGEENVAVWASEGAQRKFCKRCGASVPGLPWQGLVFVPLGNFEVDPGTRPMFHIFVGSKAPWYAITDGLTQYDEYPEGIDRIRGVTVRRFANQQMRDIAAFDRYSDWIFNNAHTRDDEMEWLKQQGPWSPALIEYLERHHQTYDVIVFFTYLYATTVLGIKVAPAKSVLVPTAHDEPAIRLGLYQDVFASAAGIVWNTDVERAFVSSNFRLRAMVEDVVGCGVDLPEGESISPEAGTDPAAQYAQQKQLADHDEIMRFFAQYN